MCVLFELINYFHYSVNNGKASVSKVAQVSGEENNWPAVQAYFVEAKTYSWSYGCSRHLWFSTFARPFAPEEKVVPKSYRPKGQPRNRNELPIRADFGNSRKHPIWRLKRGENWQPRVLFPLFGWWLNHTVQKDTRRKRLHCRLEDNQFHQKTCFRI